MRLCLQVVVYVIRYVKERNVQEGLQCLIRRVRTRPQVETFQLSSKIHLDLEVNGPPKLV